MIYKDSSFPFKDHDKLKIRIFENMYLVIQKQRGKLKNTKDYRWKE